MPDDEIDPVEVVRRGYDALSFRYRADDAGTEEYGPWIAELLSVLGSRSRVLDLGCGCGVPVTRELVTAGHQRVSWCSARSSSPKATVGTACSGQDGQHSGPRDLLLAAARQGQSATWALR